VSGTSHAGEIGAIDEQVSGPSAVVTGGRRLVDPVFGEIAVRRDVAYGRAPVGDDEAELTLDLYEPAGDAAPARPAAIYLHGGDFTSGDKAEGRRVALDLAQRGYVVASLTYRLLRLVPGVEGPYIGAIRGALSDAQAAVRWLRARGAPLRLDTDAIVALGWSAGAIVALHLAHGANAPSDHPVDAGGSARISAAVALAGAAYYFSSKAPPMLLIHGEADRVMGLQGARNTVAASVERGRDCRLVTYPDVGHDLYEVYDRWMPEVVAFLAATLDP
jgi:acetyl esterase/lipase